jgi:glutathione S-transferase
MEALKLVIGSRNGSSWSLRPWLLLKHLDLPFEEIVIPLRQADTAENIERYSPSGKVPVLLAGNQRIWDSLAIAEYLAERHPRLWPEDGAQRALARSIACEMHSGFVALRTFLPMDFTGRFGPPGMLLAAVERDIDRVLAVWTECRRNAARHGPFLFGSSIGTA